LVGAAVNGEIARALDRHDARKIAAYGEPDDTGAMAGGGVQREASWQIIGLDLPSDEVSAAAVRAREMFKLATETGGAPEDAAAALWLEGLVIGLFIAEERAAVAS
jgi:hypothetical protein